MPPPEREAIPVEGSAMKHCKCGAEISQPGKDKCFPCWKVMDRKVSAALGEVFSVLAALNRATALPDAYQRPLGWEVPEEELED